MEKIEKLHMRPMCDEYGNVWGEDWPSGREMMNKINEVIEALNQIIDKLG